MRWGTPYWMFLLFAATAGLGGGNFASSTSNISYFFPQRSKGAVLGINAAGGNLGAATVQLVVPVIVVGAGGALALASAGWMWVAPILISAVIAWFFMNNLTVASGSWREQAAVGKYADTWWLSLIYVGTFGSFMGYAAAFPLLLHNTFPSVTANLAFLGALVGSLARPFGGWLADRCGGAVVTAGSFAVMGAGVCGALYSLTSASFPIFFGSFMVLFAASGAGNGSAYRVIPTLFERRAMRFAMTTGQGVTDARKRGQREAAAVIGLTSAVGALGGFLIPRGIGSSVGHTGSITPAMGFFLGFYVLCLLVTWRRYLRTETGAAELGVAPARL